MGRSISVWAANVVGGLVGVGACSAVASDVGMAVIRRLSPVARRPSALTRNAAVEPVPNPTTMPVSTSLAAASAAAFFHWSCCDRFIGAFIVPAGPATDIIAGRAALANLKKQHETQFAKNQAAILDSKTRENQNARIPAGL